MATNLITCATCTRTAKAVPENHSELCNYCYDLSGWYNSMQDGEDREMARPAVNQYFSRLKSVLKAKNLKMPAEWVELYHWANHEAPEPTVTVTHDDEVPAVEGHKHTTGILVADVAAELNTNPKALRARLRKMGLNAPYNFTPELIESLKK